MARPRTQRIDPLADLARKSEILERELEQQRVALDRLKELSTQRANDVPSSTPARRTA